MRCAYVPVSGPSGAPDGFIAVMVDITAEAKTLRALQESEERFRRIVETASEGIWIINPEGLATFANSRMCELLGYHFGGTAGPLLFSLYPPGGPGPGQ